MFITMKELMDKYIEEGYSIQKVFRNNREHNIGTYKYLGYINIWNEVGCVEYTFNMYKSKVRHTILYDVYDE